VLAFDVFGTLLDWRSGLVAELSAIARERNLSIDSAGIADAWRRKAGSLLQKIAVGKRPFRPFEDVLETALLLLAREPSISAVPLRDLPRLLQTWHRLPAWPDAAAGLRRLRSCYAVTTLSNGGRKHLVDVTHAADLAFDRVFSTEEVKSYKPDPRTYQLVPSVLRVQPDRVMMVASHGYDLKGAAAQGLRTAFIRRPQEWGTGKPEALDFPVDLAADDLLDLAAQLDG
jgi:2-haloacid dehalogenase